jgi:hypothetical protein
MSGRTALVLAMLAFSISATPSRSQSPQPPSDAGVPSDDMLTLVVGTRFVAASTESASARGLFTGSRIPLSAFNETDHCIDQQALEVAQAYFTALGRILGTAGHYYFIPEDEVRKAVAMCERLHHRAPQAWADDKTKIIAFGRVVPTADAPALEESIR